MRAPSGTDLLFFLEDPGAANFVLDFPDALESRGLVPRLAAIGPAQAFLRSRNLDFFALDSLDAAKAALSRFHPRLAVLGTADRPDALNLPLADHCRSLVIPTAGFLDGYGNLERRFGDAGNPLSHAPDWILAPDPRTRERYIAYGFDPERVLDLGHPGLERVSAEKARLQEAGRESSRARLFPDAPKGALILVFAAEVCSTPDPAQYRRDKDYTLGGTGLFLGRTEIVLEEVLDALDAYRAKPGSAPVYIVLRLHPKNALEEFAPFADRIDLISHGGAAHELVFAADALIGMTSLLLLEAAHLSVPVLSVIPRALEAEWLWSIGSGHTPCAATRSDVIREVAALLERVSAPVRPSGVSLPDPGGALRRYVGFFEARLGMSARG